MRSGQINSIGMYIHQVLGSYGYTNSDYLVSSYASVNIYNDNVYYANVSTGYLALRNAKAFDSANEISKVPNSKEVDVIDFSTGTYWYGICT